MNIFRIRVLLYGASFTLSCICAMICFATMSNQLALSAAGFCASTAVFCGCLQAAAAYKDKIVPKWCSLVMWTADVIEIGLLTYPLWERLWAPNFVVSLNISTSSLSIFVISMILIAGAQTLLGLAVGRIQPDDNSDDDDNHDDPAPFPTPPEDHGYPRPSPNTLAACTLLIWATYMQQQRVKR